jgi:hypothetical protein
MLHICLLANAQLPMPDSVCVGSTKRYHVNDATVPSTYIWKINGITQSSTSYEIFVTWATDGVYTISVQEENASGCKGQLEQGVVYVLPIPIPNAGPDAAICFENTARLNGSGGAIYQWSPSTYLSNPAIANPIVISPPQGALTYFLNVTNAKGCKSIKSDTVVITVLPPVKVFAGNDTSIAINQPLQLNAFDVNNSGLINYLWSPSSGLIIAILKTLWHYLTVQLVTME